MKEIWKVYRDTRISKNGKHIKNEGKLYELSNYGRIRINGIITEPKNFMNTCYYACPASRYSDLLHRNIAKLFIDNPENKPCVDHIDGNKHNNRVDNLRWVTHKENSYNPVTRKKFLEANSIRFSNPLYVSQSKGKHRSEETKNKIRNKLKGNSNVKGYVFIHNGKVNKMIPKYELNNYISNGWTKGRINIHERYNTDTAGIDEILSIDTDRNF